MSAAAAARLRLAVLISGGGSNMAAIARACASGQIAAEIAVVISDRPDAPGLLRAQQAGIVARTVAAARFRSTAGFDRAAFETALRKVIDESGAQFVVLAGFMRILARIVAPMRGACSISTPPCCRNTPVSIPMRAHWPPGKRTTAPACTM